MNPAPLPQTARREYSKHGDSYRLRLLKERGVDAIDGRTAAGKRAKKWGTYALDKKGGKQCPIDVRETIDGAVMYLWRALEARSYIVADARRRGTPLNKRRVKLPPINDQHDSLFEAWRRINAELDLRELDLAR